MKTAVEWLIEERFGRVEDCTPSFRKCINQAKQMEKEQLMDSFNTGKFELDGFTEWESYYNETYKNTDK